VVWVRIQVEVIEMSTKLFATKATMNANWDVCVCGDGYACAIGWGGDKYCGACVLAQKWLDKNPVEKAEVIKECKLDGELCEMCDDPK